MKKVSAVLVVALMAMFVICGSAKALVIGLPDVAYDTTATNSAGDLGSGLSYLASSGLLSVEGIALSITRSGGTTNLLDTVIEYGAKLISTNVSGPLVKGNFGTAALSPDLMIYQDVNQDFDRDLGEPIFLSGDFHWLNVVGITGMNTGFGEAIFGNLAGLWAPEFLAVNPDAGMVNLYFNLSPGFSSTMYTSNFSGEAKGDIAPPVVPEPASMLLLGTGLLGLIGFGKRKFFA